MKKLFLGLFVIGLLGSFFVQAKWENLPYSWSGSQGISINKEGLWATFGKYGTSASYLTKWDEQKKDWDEKALVSKSSMDGYSLMSAISGHAVFVFGRRKELTEEFKKALPAMREVRKKAEDMAIQTWLEKLVTQKKAERSIIDLWKASQGGGPDEHTKWSETFAKIETRLGSQAMMLARKSFSEASGKSVADFMKKENIKVFTRPVFRFFEGKLEKFYDFDDEDDFFAVAALNDEEILAVKVAGKKFEIRKISGKSWKLLATKLVGKDQRFSDLQVGADGTIFFLTRGSSGGLEISKWNGSVWIPIDTSFIKNYAIESFSIVTQDRIWFIASLPKNVVKSKKSHSDFNADSGLRAYLWNGKSLEQKNGELDLRYVLASPSQVLVLDGYGKIYKLIE